MADVFLSFSSQDAERVARIHAGLIERNVDVWWMHDLLPGDSAIQTVSRELTSAKRVLLAWSRHAEESPYVEGEVMHAFGTRKLLPVRIEKWAWPAFLASVQYLDMTAGDDEREAWRQIEARLQQQGPQPEARVATPRIAAPRSAGPVRLLAAMMLVLALALVGVLAMALQAVRNGDVQVVMLVQYGVIALPAISGALVLLAAQRVWGAWRARSAYLERAER
jgi:hypothetical protein